MSVFTTPRSMMSASSSEISTDLQAVALGASPVAADTRQKSRAWPTRLQSLPPYVFAVLDAKKAEVRAKGVELIDLGMGNHDMPTPDPILEVLSQALQTTRNHQYPDFKGSQGFRESAAHYVNRRFGASLSPETDIQPLIGSKEGITHLILAYSTPGDIVLMPALHYPAYLRATLISGATPHYIPMTSQGLPDLKAIPSEVLDRATVLLLNFPNNPSTVCATPEYWREAIALAKAHELVLVSDMAYGEIAFNGHTTPSVLAEEGGYDVAVEFYSCSKTFNMAGWRIGFAAGNKEIIEVLYRIKSNMDYGVNTAIQEAAAFAMNHAETLVPPITARYHQRRDLLLGLLHTLGCTHLQAPEASFYLWLPVPEGYTADSFTLRLIEECGVVVTPGTAFGADAGKYHVRLSLVQPEEKLREACERMTQAGIRWV
ncbi:MAG: aminotransferase class I/II-fold pyridoxal phosphate-dependent enzyme [Vampirovibrionales bacterium]